MRKSKYQRRLEKLGLVIRQGKGAHRVVLDPEGKHILGVFPITYTDGQPGRAHQNLRASIRRSTGIDIGK